MKKPPVPTAEITQERLQRWAKLLEESDATPALLLGIGHNRFSGLPVLLTTEDMDRADIRTFLEMALAALS